MAIRKEDLRLTDEVRPEDVVAGAAEGQLDDLLTSAAVLGDPEAMPELTVLTHREGDPDRETKKAAVAEFLRAQGADPDQPDSSFPNVAAGADFQHFNYFTRTHDGTRLILVETTGPQWDSDTRSSAVYVAPHPLPVGEDLMASMSASGTKIRERVNQQSMPEEAAA